MKVITGRHVAPTLLEIENYYGARGEREVADRKVKAILEAIRDLRQTQIGHRADNRLPANYRARVLEKYRIFYRVDQDIDTIFVYDVRHAARKPLTPDTHRRKANEARRTYREN